MTQKETEQFMQTLMGAVEEIVQEANGGKPMAVTILLAPFGGGVRRCHYISNAKRQDMIKMIRSSLIRFEAGSDDRVDQQNPSLN